MGVIGGGDQNGIDVFLVKNFAKVLIKGRLWELLSGLADAAGIHITKSGHGPAGWFDFNEIGTTPTGYPDDANANLLGGRIPVGGANQWNGGGRTQKERSAIGTKARHGRVSKEGENRKGRIGSAGDCLLANPFLAS